LGNLLVVFCGHLSTGSISSVTDNMGVGNVWNAVFDSAVTDGYSAGWYYTFTKGSGPCTVTVNMNTSTGGGQPNIYEASGPNTLRASSAVNVQSGTTASTSPAITTTAGDLLLGFWASGTPNTLTAGATSTIDTVNNRARN